MEVVINGAGLVGSLAAIYFLEFTPNITVVEKRSDIRKATYETGRSINLILTSRGLFALRAVGLEKDALELCVPVQGRAIHNLKGWEKPVFQPYGVNPNEVNYSVSRTRLNAMLIDAAERRGAKFVFQMEVEHVDFNKNAATYVDCSHSQPTLGDVRRMTLKADVFLGTDGVASMTRQLLLEQLRCEGVATQELIQRLGISYKELTFPATKDGSYSMDVRGLHIWPRGPAFLMALADKTATFTGTLYLPDGSAPLNIPGIESMPTFDELGKSREAYEKYITTVYADVPGLVPDYLEQLSSRSHSFLATMRSSHWVYKDQLALLGDAGLGVVPFFGQGMNLGFESLGVLVRFIKIFGFQDKEHRAKAFAAFARYHQPSANAIADMAIENFTEMSYKVGLPEFIARKQIENAVESMFPSSFRSRYYMVTKTLIPYATVKQAGPHVEKVVDVITAELKKRSLDAGMVMSLPKEIIERAIAEHFTPFIAEHKIKLDQPFMDYYPTATAGSKL
jgi:kynurenine 3-monooxygenase